MGQARPQTHGYIPILPNAEQAHMFGGEKNSRIAYLDLRAAHLGPFDKNSGTPMQTALDQTEVTT
jgi:hypothetical protein